MSAERNGMVRSKCGIGWFPKGSKGYELLKEQSDALQPFLAKDGSVIWRDTRPLPMLDKAKLEETGEKVIIG